MASSSSRRKTAPNDLPALVVTAVLFLIYPLWGAARVDLLSVLQGTIPVMWVVCLRHLPWCAVRGRWQRRHVLTSLSALALAVCASWLVVEWRWWNVMVLVVMGILTLMGMQLHRWTSLVLLLCCGLSAWLLL